MTRVGVIFVSVLVWTSVGLQAYAGRFAITLEARSGDQEQSAHNHSTSDPAAARPALAAKAKASLRVQWSIASTGKTETAQDVTVHCFLAKEGAIGQQALPDLTKVVAYESALTMDFEPGAKSSANFSLRAPEPGNYLLRVETIGPNQDDRHPDFAAMDLRVE